MRDEDNLAKLSVSLRLKSTTDCWDELQVWLMGEVCPGQGDDVMEDNLGCRHESLLWGVLDLIIR